MFVVAIAIVLSSGKLCDGLDDVVVHMAIVEHTRYVKRRKVLPTFIRNFRNRCSIFTFQDGPFNFVPFATINLRIYSFLDRNSTRYLGYQILFLSGWHARLMLIDQIIVSIEIPYYRNVLFVFLTCLDDYNFLPLHQSIIFKGPSFWLVFEWILILSK